ncbi:MAG: sulfatase [Candidatus Nitrosotenuis sp.]
MAEANKQIIIPNISYWRVFRLLFTIFSLYLLKDAFYRWDGFKYHSTFFEFLPSAALVTILWTLVAVFSALIVWLLLNGIEWFCNLTDRKITMDFFLMFLAVFTFLTAGTWIGKRMLIKESFAPISKSIILILIFFLTFFLSWRYRNKFSVIHERITPLVWLFGIWVMVSFPIVIYHTWLKPTNNPAPPINQFIKSDISRPNIILVIFDALTARDMSVYGYNKVTTPFINVWSKTASLFNRFKSSSDWTTPATASLMTGKRVWTHRTFQEYSPPVKSNIESLPLVLKKNGYYNIAFVVNPYASIDKLGITNGFDIAPSFLELVESKHLIGWKFGILNVVLTRVFGGKIKFYTWIIDPQFIFGKIITAVYYKLFTISQTEAPPEIAFKKFLETLDKGVREPFFAWIHLYPPHGPYLPPVSYIGIFDSSTELRSFNQQRIELTEEKINIEEHWNIFKARYDEFIRYCDKTFEDFITNLLNKDKLKNTIIIFTSDHGESFEHGDFTHGHAHLYEQVTHIPLIIKEPDQTNGVVINDLVEQIDIAPTILDLVNIPIPSWMEGRSVAPLLRGEKLSPKPVFSMNFKKNPSRGHQISEGTIAVWEGDYKLIYYLKDGKSLLFNLKNDPEELDDISNEKSSITRHLLALIQDNLLKINKGINMVD